MDGKQFREKYAFRIPRKPGVYRFLDSGGNILYVGKARNLKKRVSSYYTKKHDSARLKMLVKKTSDIAFTIVENEHDALLLENSLIKKFQPRYNVMLKDGKSYPFLCIKKEPFPRVFLTRNRVDDGSVYLGPYTSVTRVKAIMEFIRLMYPLRTCNYHLSPENIRRGKFKVCLEYHIGNCLGPCEGLQNESDYQEYIRQIKHILSGHIQNVLQHLKQEKKSCADRLEFEKAASIKKKIEHLEKFQGKSTIVNPRLGELDVIALKDSGQKVWVHYFRVKNGTIILDHSMVMTRKMEEKPEELLALALVDLQERFASTAREVIVPFKPDIEIPGITFTVPRKGDKHHLLELCYKNVLQFENSQTTRLDKYKQRKKYPPSLEQLKTDFRLDKLPLRIECFDNSNFQGAYPVASMVAFTNGRPDKKEYRHYNIKTVEGPNDFASMEEVVYRRYRRLLKEAKPLPDLILIDGGKGQLNAAWKSLKKLGISEKIKLAAIAKRLEEIYLPGDPVPLHINKRSPGLKLLQSIRNEAHRFAITFHRKKRQQATLSTELTDIPGIGVKTADQLLTHFHSVQKIREASVPDLAAFVGIAKAKAIKDYFSG